MDLLAWAQDSAAVLIGLLFVAVAVLATLGLTARSEDN